METSVIQIEFKNGSIFRVFCANKSQKRRLLQMYDSVHKAKIKGMSEVANGIHTVTQFEKFLQTI